MSDDSITAVEIQETEYGQKLVIDSPFEAKDFIKVLPWKKMSEEVMEHGSIREKAVSRGMSENNVAVEEAEDFGFSDDFASHASWEPTALGPDDGAWMIDVDSWGEASDFFESAGFETSVEEDVNL